MSLNAAAFALERRFGIMRLPRFNLIEVGNSNLISLEKVLSRVDGLRDVVTKGLGSDRPESIEYSSSMLCCASADSGSSDSSYL